MATVRELLDRLRAVVSFDKAAEWDPVGLQIGDPEAETGSVGVCHEVTGPIVVAAEEAGVGTLVSYHPLLFQPVSRLIAGPGAAGRALRLAAARIALVVTHTGFDVAQGGSADALVEALGLEDARPFGAMPGAGSKKVVTFVPAVSVDEVADAMAAAGGGRIGDYEGCSFRSVGKGTFTPLPGAQPTAGVVGERAIEDEVRLEMAVPTPRVGAVLAALAGAHPYEEPAYDVFDRLGESGFVGRIGAFRGDGDALLEAIRDLGAAPRLTALPPGSGLVVAVVPGSGSSLIEAAADAGATVLVTGDIKHHDARRAAEMGLAVIDAGHAVTEGPGVARLYAAVAAVVDAAVDLTGIDADPWIR